MMSYRRLALSATYWAFVVYLLVPLLLMILMGFKDSNFIGFPITNWTLRWYVEVVSDLEVLSVFVYSLTIALLTTVLSLVVGVWIAMFLAGTRFWGKTLVFALVCLPAVIPGIISAISLRLFVREIGLEPGMSAIILGHTVHNVPFVTLVILARLNAMPSSLVEAARDLGADEAIAFVRVTLPFLWPSIIGACVFCLLLSFDDFVRSFFLGGYEPTLPVLIFALLRSGMSPEINAIATVVLVLTAVLGLWAERSMRQLQRG